MIILDPKTADSFDDVWIHENFLDSKFFTQIENFLILATESQADNFEGRELSYGNEKFKLIGTFHYRPYIKLWDLSQHKDYWNQTNDSILDWANKNYGCVIHPVARKLISKIQQVEPFAGQDFVAVRGILNLLKPGVPLDAHQDGGGFIYQDDSVNVYSATFYVQTEGEGGEYYDLRGFIHKPNPNSLLVNIGNRTLHGVRASDKLRLGITIRFIRAQDLLLPGSVDQLLFKPTTL